MLECLTPFYSWYKLSVFIIFGVCIIYRQHIRPDDNSILLSELLLETNEAKSNVYRK